MASYQSPSKDNLKAPVGYFIGNHHIYRRLDPNIQALDGIYNIKDKSTLHILVANFTNKHVTVNKGQYIGLIEPSNDHMPQTAINSLTTQRMTDEHIQADSFTPPIHTLRGDVRKSVNFWRHLNHNLHKLKIVLKPLISLKCKLTQVTQSLSY